MILNIIHAGGGSIIPSLKMFGFKISARIFNQLTPAKFMKRDLGCARCIPTGIFLFRGGVYFQLNASYKSCTRIWQIACTDGIIYVAIERNQLVYCCDWNNSIVINLVTSVCTYRKIASELSTIFVYDRAWSWCVPGAWLRGRLDRIYFWTSWRIVYYLGFKKIIWQRKPIPFNKKIIRIWTF